MTDRQTDVSRRHVADVGGREAEFNRALGELIRANRLRRGLTQVQLGLGVGVSRASIANLERGNQAPSAYRLVDLAKALRCDPADLLPNPNEAVSSARQGLTHLQLDAVERTRSLAAKKRARKQ